MWSTPFDHSTKHKIRLKAKNAIQSDAFNLAFPKIVIVSLDRTQKIGHLCPMRLFWPLFRNEKKNGANTVLLDKNLF